MRSSTLPRGADLFGRARARPGIRESLAVIGVSIVPIHEKRPRHPRNGSSGENGVGVGSTRGATCIRGVLARGGYTGGVMAIERVSRILHVFAALFILAGSVQFLFPR
jgi:hypothetical protein